ncbi:unnamed protein product [Rhizophagus irregularis]|nr:unnamed protein product [Rhizophagus irregularis]
MKSLSSFPFFVLFIAIFSIIAFMSPVEADHTVWIHNKLDKGTQAIAAVTHTNEKETWHWSPDNNDAIFESYSFAHEGFYLTVPSKVSTYWLVFGVGGSAFEEDKWRGPFENTQDLCFHYHGNLVKWELWQC